MLLLLQQQYPLQVVLLQVLLELPLAAVRSTLCPDYALHLISPDKLVYHLAQGLHALRPEHDIRPYQILYSIPVCFGQELLVILPVKHLYF